ncbi:MAG TPA: DUF2071 domain-containing protein, partial [Tepidisphaeraceae bacterium]|nr:DUF2071 domain-containing protein [Tepidisphaeraceae bacterium]
VPAVLGARAGYGLPYYWSQMRVARSAREMKYQSRRRRPQRNAVTDITIIEKDPIEANDLEIFLTARFRLYSRLFGRLIYADVEHEPWPLRSAESLAVKQTLIQAAGLPSPADAPLVHFSRGVHVRIGRPKLLTC